MTTQVENKYTSAEQSGFDGTGSVPVPYDWYVAGQAEIKLAIRSVDTTIPVAVENPQSVTEDANRRRSRLCPVSDNRLITCLTEAGCSEGPGRPVGPGIVPEIHIPTAVGEGDGIPARDHP